MSVLGLILEPPTKRPSEGAFFLDHADTAINAGLDLRRYAMKPMAAKPRIIIAQVPGSGTGGANWTSIKPTEPAEKWSPAKFTVTESGAKLIVELVKSVTVLLGSTNAAKIGESPTGPAIVNPLNEATVKLNGVVP
jgi:hypothetical protein